MKIVLLWLAVTTALLAGDEASWTTYGKNYSGWRYSESTKIDAKNVKRLAPAWIFQTHAPAGMETTPLVKDGVMYITGTSNHAWAVDLKTGKPIWHYSKTPKK